MNYLDNITEQAYNYILCRFEEQRKLSQSEGGIIRTFSGQTVESMVDLIWSELSKYYPNITSQIFVGKDKPIEIYSGVKESVDRHCFINDIFVCGIECKTYLDKCYMQRADSDFSLMKTNNNFKGIIISLENGIADNSFNFFMKRNNIDEVFYCSIGKRNSQLNKRIYYHPDRIIKEYIYSIVEYLNNFFVK